MACVRHRRRVVALLGALALLALATGCANEVTDFVIEQPLGALSELAINMQFPIDKDPLVRSWVGRIGAQHRANVHRKDVPYRFSVVDVAAPNAFAIPWGGVYVTKGLLRFATSEDEVAFVVGHEVGHVERRHSSLAFQRNLLIGLGLSLATTRKTEDVMQLAYLGSYFLDLHFSRENETMADRAGAMFATWAGYDPHSSLAFFRRLDQRYGATPRTWGYFQTHPINRDRINDVRRQPYLSQTDAVMLTTIGDGYRKRDQFLAAERSYQQAVVADPNYGDAYLGLARVAAWRGTAPVAQARYEEALRRGADAAACHAELAAVVAEPAPPDPLVVLASARDAGQARMALAAGTRPVEAALSLAAPLAEQPFDAGSALVAAQQSAGSQIDGLVALGSRLSDSSQALVNRGQRLRATAVDVAGEVGEAGAEAKETAQLLESNRARIQARLDAAPTAAALSLARRVLAENAAVAAELQEATGGLKAEHPVVSTALRQSQEAIAALSRELRGGDRYGVSSSLEGRLRTAQEAVERANERVQRHVSQIRLSRARGLVSSIDITLLDRPRHERVTAERLVTRFMLLDPAAMEPLRRAGLSYGEIAYLAGFAKSSSREPATLLTDVGSEPEQVVTRLDKARVRSGNVSVVLRLLDLTLRREFDPTSNASDATA